MSGCDFITETGPEKFSAALEVATLPQTQVPNPRSSPSPSPSQVVLSVPQRVQALFDQRCAVCHGPDSPGLGNFGTVLSREAMIASGVLIPGQAAQSRLYLRSADNTMPPGAPIPAAEIALIQEWINGGAQPFNTGAANPTPSPSPSPEAPRVAITNAQTLALIAADQQAVPQADRRFMRYFTFGHLNNNSTIKAARIASNVKALTKAINSLTWAKTLVQPTAIDPQKTIYRLDIRAVEWNDQQWNALVATYPYRTFETNDAFQQNLRNVVSSAGNTLPYVRGDWFAVTATLPDNYHRFLNLPDTLGGLEVLLNLNIRENLLRRQVLRSGFRDSNVSFANRVMERHTISTGAFWISYDFEGSLGEENIFERPVGPPNLTGQNPNVAFQHDGGEAIWNLPNGLQAYFLVTAAGARINTGPPQIVQDPIREDKLVTNGISCMICHPFGINPKADEIRKQNFQGDLLRSVQELYSEKAVLDNAFAADIKRFMDAQKQIGITELDPEPIAVVYKQHEQILDSNTVSQEIGVTPAVLLEEMRNEANLPAALLPLTRPTGTISRRDFDANIGRIVRAVGMSRNVPTQ